MKTLYKLSTALIVFVMLVWAGCASNKVSTMNYAGTYDWSISMDSGDLSGTITLNHSGDGYTGTIDSEQGSSDLSNLKVDGSNITASFEYMGYDVTLKGTLSEHDLKGSFSAEGYDFPFDAKKKE